MIFLPRGCRNPDWTRTPLPSWIPVSLPDGRKTADVVCPNGHQGLIEDHEIAASGQVSPSVVCTQDGCTWHVWIKLEGWEP
jgi:hypothetical protein